MNKGLYRAVCAVAAAALAFPLAACGSGGGETGGRGLFPGEVQVGVERGVGNPVHGWALAY